MKQIQQIHTLNLLVFFVIVITSTNLKSQNLEPQVDLTALKVEFKGAISENVKEVFIKVLSQYTELHDYEIEVKRKRIKSTTMQAQPVFSFKALFKGVKKYKIELGKYVLDSDNLEIQNLPEDVIAGWFAHELGHLVDYEAYSNGQMIWYGLKYLISGNFRKKVEYEADYNAIKSGFFKEILAAKQFVLENNIGEDYLNRIQKYYLSVDDIQAYAEDKALFHSKEEVDDL